MKKQLRNCTAFVNENDSRHFYVNIDGHTIATLAGGELPLNHRVRVLTSYNSIVAAYDVDTHTIYLFPRWDYSVTTLSHVRKFAEDYAGVTLYKNDVLRGNTIAIICDGFKMDTRDGWRTF